MKLKELKDTVVNLRTQAEYDEFMRICEKAGWFWDSGARPTKKNYWDGYRGNICISCRNEFYYSSKKYFQEGYEIITLAQFKQMQNIKKTLENLEVGELVMDMDNERDYKTVLAKGQENGELTTYLLSGYSKNKNSEALRRVGDWYTVRQLREYNYEPVIEEETKEMTVKEISKELGYEVKIIK